MPPAAAFETNATKARPRGRPRKSQEERDDGNRRQALLRAAAKLFRRKGFAATTTRDIASAADMRSGSPFYHFKSKSALLYAVMEEGMTNALERQHEVLLHPDYAKLPPQDQLRQLIGVHFDVLLGPGNDFVPVMLYEWRSLTAIQRKAMRQLVQNYEGLWLPVLQALHDCEFLVAPVGIARLLLLGALNWSVQWYDPRKDASLNDLSDAAIQLFIKAQ